MKKRSFVALIFSLFLFSNAGLYALWLPAYPFEVSYSLYSGEKKGDVSNFLHINAGLRFEALKQVYFDLSFLGDIFLHVNKKNGLYGEMLQKDAREFLNFQASQVYRFPYRSSLGNMTSWVRFLFLENM